MLPKGELELTPDQQRMPRIYLTRGMQEVFQGFSLRQKWGPLGLRERIRHRTSVRAREKNGGPIVYLAGGCGSAEDINEVTDHLRGVHSRARGRIIGLGVDLNPIPEWAIGAPLPFRMVEKPDFSVPARPEVQLMRGDVQCMDMIPDESVDGMWLMGVLTYVRDKLAALNEMHRVLKPGGFGFASTVEWAMTHPHFLQIMGETPGAEDVFRVYYDPTEYEIRGGLNIIGCYKPEDPARNVFRGFDQRFVRAVQSPSKRSIVAGSHAELFCYSEYA